MIPYFTYMLIAQSFLFVISGLGSEPREGMDHVKVVILAGLTLILWFDQVMQEMI